MLIIVSEKNFENKEKNLKSTLSGPAFTTPLRLGNTLSKKNCLKRVKSNFIGRTLLSKNIHPNHFE